MFDNITIKIDEEPPKSTAQMKKVSASRGKVRFYEPKTVKEAKRYFYKHLAQYMPKDKINEPITLYVEWVFANQKNKKGTYAKITRPDLDNLQKLLKDCLTGLHYWVDDSLVVEEHTKKLRADHPYLYISISPFTKYNADKKID